MEDLLDELDAVRLTGHYLGAVMMALVVPDIAGALAAPNGQATGARYEKWFDHHLGPVGYDGWLSGEDCYKFRCSLLHQGSAQHPKNSKGQRIVMMEPHLDRSIFHLNSYDEGGLNALQLDAKEFCVDVHRAGAAWWASAQSDPTVVNNNAAFVRRSTSGLAGQFRGRPLIA